MRIVDLRSDTVTRPTLKMRQAMKDAEVGDDGFGDDPATNRFEKMAADCVGKEDALFVPSGTMGNLIAIMVHAKPGEGLICDKFAHINTLVAGNTAALTGTTICPLEVDESGHFDLNELESNINLDNIHFPRTSLIVLENSNNLAGGTVVTPEDTSEISRIAKRHNLRFHLDGARVFNSAIAQGVDVVELTGNCDSVMFCLSKGLASPVGSIIAGTKTFIKEARRIRKMLGGVMRQTGILAACGIISLEEMIDRLAEDHDNARYLAKGIEGIDGFSINLKTVQTNIICFKFELPKLGCKEFVDKVAKKGIYVVHLYKDFGRMVTHKDLNKSDLDYAMEVFKNTVSEQ
ncbi:MAG: GntG family PLP-dependent aldolase [Candidatus Scalindua sp.]|nr:GntG family PLP-dependent aldolase [Candidatus Scalindua sp.]MDV5165655.1 GntG family PLP-dependent aldolase [Candidatus Scalindua sp.]